MNSDFPSPDLLADSAPKQSIDAAVGAILVQQAQAFRARHGREPQGDDPILFESTRPGNLTWRQLLDQIAPPQNDHALLAEAPSEVPDAPAPAASTTVDDTELQRCLRDALNCGATTTEILASEAGIAHAAMMALIERKPSGTIPPHKHRLLCFCAARHLPIVGSVVSLQDIRRVLQVVATLNLVDLRDLGREIRLTSSALPNVLKGTRLIDTKSRWVLWRGMLAAGMIRDPAQIDVQPLRIALLDLVGRRVATTESIADQSTIPPTTLEALVDGRMQLTPLDLSLLDMVVRFRSHTPNA